MKNQQLIGTVVAAAGLLLNFGFTLALGTVDPRGKEEWTHIVKLDPENGFVAKWFNTPAKTDGSHWIEMEISANTRGYVGLGFSPKGGMAGADIVIGWVDRMGIPHLKDFHGESNDKPIIDERQDYELISGQEDETGTTIRFRRQWDSCDENDMELTTDTTRLIWALDKNDPVFRMDGSLQMNYHQMNRGVRNVLLADDAMSASFPDEQGHSDPSVKHWDMRMKNLEVSKTNTTYHCTIVKFPDSQNKQHMIGWKPLIQPENLKWVHHMVFLECTVPEHLVSLFDEHSESHPGEACYTKNMAPEWARHCQGSGYLLVWTVGSEGELLPEHVGGTLGQQHGGATYFLIEAHYENPEGLTFTDNSGIRIFYTDKLREHDGAGLYLGYGHTPFLMIPPKQENFTSYAICDPQCFQNSFPKTGIHVVTTLLHAHLQGRKLRLRHFRNGVELPPIAEDGYYDFNYQQGRVLKNEITILPGDELVTECEFSTSDMDRIVLGGLATSQEMCQAQLFYYPRVDVKACTSQPEFTSFMKGLGIEGASGDVLNFMQMPFDPLIYGSDPTDIAKSLQESGDGTNFRSVFDEITVTEPKNLRGMTVGEHLRHMNWNNKDLGKYVQDSWKNGKHYQFCSAAASQRIALKNYITTFPQITKPLKKLKNGRCSANPFKRGITNSLSMSGAISNSDFGYFNFVTYASLALMVAHRPFGGWIS